MSELAPRPAHGRLIHHPDGSRQLLRPWYIGPPDIERYVKHLGYAETREARLATGGDLRPAEAKDALLNAWMLCQGNAAFLAHEYCQIGLPEGGVRPFDAWTPGQRQLYRAIQMQRVAGKPVRVIVLKARKEGVSTLCELLAYWRTAFFLRANAIIAGHEVDSATTCFEIFKLFHDSLPEPLRPHTENFTTDEILFDNHDPRTRKDSPGNGSRIRTRTVALGGGTKDKQGKGRSQTIHFLHGTEAAYWAEPAKFYGGVANGIGDVEETYAILESTANAHGWFAEQWDDAARGYELVRNQERGTSEWLCTDPRASDSDTVPVFLSWLAEPRYRRAFDSDDDKEYFARNLDPDETMLRDAYGASLEQLHWRRRKIHSASIGGDLQLFHQEYPTTPQEAFVSSGRKVFSVPALRWARAQILNSDTRARRWDFWLDAKGLPQRHENPDGPVWIYREPEPDVEYGLGSDASYGKAKGDKATTQILRLDAWEQCAVISGNLDDDALAALNVALGRYYGGSTEESIEESIAVIEVNGPGLSVQRKMEALGYENFYYRTVPDDLTQKPARANGWWSSGKTRTIMVSALKAAVRDMPTGTGLILHHGPTIDEMEKWVLHTNPAGKAKEQPDASNGYDDQITSTGVVLVGACIEGGHGAPIASKTVGNPDGKELGDIEEAKRRKRIPSEDPAYIAGLFAGQASGASNCHPVLGAMA